MKKFFNDFKKFISKGNVLDLAVGIIIGSVFTAIVNSAVKDVIMPFITLLTGKGLDSWVWVVKGAQFLEDGVTVNPEAIIIRYGNFLQAIINFFITAFVLFMILRFFMRIKGIVPKFYGYDKLEYLEMRSKGMKKAEIKQKAKARDEEAARRKKLEEEEKKKHSTEGLLEDIKAILEKKSAE